MSRMKSDARNSPLQRFRLMVLSVADHRMADRRKLHADLILQSRHQRNSNQRRAAQTPFDAIPKFSTSCLRVVPAAQLLEHSLSSKVMNQCPFFILSAGMSPNDSQILPHRTVVEKLSNQGVAIPFCFCE